MRKIWLYALLAASLVTPVLAHADVVAKDGTGGSITLHDAPCTSSKTLEAVANVMKANGAEPAVVATYQGSMRAATTVFQGRVIEACWLPHGDHVDVVDAEGDGGAIPNGAFEPALSVDSR